MTHASLKSYPPESDPESEALEPDLRICDAHHHIWLEDGLIPYSVADFARDTSGGHRIESSIYIECDQGYRDSGPAELRPVGETERAVRFAEESCRLGGAQIRGIVPLIDPRMGHGIDAVIDAHQDAAKGLLCGFRARTGYDPARQYVPAGHQQWPGQMLEPAFAEGAARIGRRGLVLELLFYHSQLHEAVALAQKLADTPIVINHLAFPIGVGGYEQRRNDVEASWRSGLAKLAKLPHVSMKIGGFGMRLFGHGWPDRGRPVTSDEIVAQVGARVRFAIDTFGPQRCIFESNFPVDGLSFGYTTLWNALKKMSAGYSSSERAALLHDTAVTTYGLLGV